MPTKRDAMVTVLVATVTSIATSAVVPAIADKAAELRVEGFHEYVSTHIGAWRSSRRPHGPARDQRWAAAHPDLLLAEGRAACRWLGDRPSLPAFFEVEAVTVHDLGRRYLRETADQVPRGLSPRGRDVIVAGAWDHLCGDTRDDKTADPSSD